MAKLDAAARKAIPTGEFAGPGRSYPINDANHARAALSMLHNAPASEQPGIRAKAEAKLKGASMASPQVSAQKKALTKALQQSAGVAKKAPPKLAPKMMGPSDNDADDMYR